MIGQKVEKRRAHRPPFKKELLKRERKLMQYRGGKKEKLVAERENWDRRAELGKTKDRYWKKRKELLQPSYLRKPTTGSTNEKEFLVLSKISKTKKE